MGFPSEDIHWALKLAPYFKNSPSESDIYRATILLTDGLPEGTVYPPVEQDRVQVKPEPGAASRWTGPSASLQDETAAQKSLEAALEAAALEAAAVDPRGTAAVDPPRHITAE